MTKNIRYPVVFLRGSVSVRKGYRDRTTSKSGWRILSYMLKAHSSEMKWKLNWYTAPPPTHTQTLSHIHHLKKGSHHPPLTSLLKYCIHLNTHASLYPSFFKSFHEFLFFVVFKRLVWRHSQACFCIIRASGCIWRETNDSVAFQLKWDPPLIYPLIHR